jgi:hypothetical protein
MRGKLELQPRIPAPRFASGDDNRHAALRRGTLAALGAIWILSGSAAAEAGAGSRTPFQQNLSHGGSDLTLHSASLKEATFLKVDVYWIGLYLEAADTPPDSVISSTQVKAFVFHFLRDVKSAKLQEAWIQDLTLSCKTGCRSVLAQGRVLARSMPDIQSSQKIAYILFSDRVEVLIDGTSLGTLVGASATQAILATFLGPTAPLEMRNDLIGAVTPPVRR